MSNVEQAISQLTSLSVEERLQVVEAVWNSLESVPVTMSPEQREELNRRVDAYEADPSRVLSWDQLLERLRGRL